MAIISEQELNELRQSYLEIFTDLATVKHYEKVTDIYGGTTTNETVTNDVPSMIMPGTGGAEEIIGNVEQVLTAYTITLAYGYTITESDVIVMRGYNHEVISIANDYSYQLVITAYCKRIY